MRAKAVAFCLVAAGVAAAGVSAVPGAPPPAKVAACATGEIGFLGPLTGPFATIGREQLDWATLAVDRFNAANATRFTVRSGDTRLVPRLAVKVGSAFASDKSMLATVGPTGSQEVMAVGEVFTRRGLPGVLASATSVTLTGGAYPTFSRVVGSNVVQGKSDAFFMVDKLNAKKVLIVDDEEPYSTLIATSASNVLKANGVQVKRRSVSQTATDFSSLIAGMASGTDVVFLPWQVASNAELFAQQLRDQGVTTKILGSDGLDSAQFTAPGAYVSSFSRDIHGLAGAAAVIAAYEAAHGTKWGLFGPPSYVAAQVIATAYKAACADGTATRAELRQAIRAVKITRSILGAPVAFDKHGEMPSARYYVSQIQSSGKHKLVW